MFVFRKTKASGHAEFDQLGAKTSIRQIGWLHQEFFKLSFRNNSERPASYCVNAKLMNISAFIDHATTDSM